MQERIWNETTMLMFLVMQIYECAVTYYEMLIVVLAD